jgi:predicted enzyme related to lactoylglutathione lyase
MSTSTATKATITGMDLCAYLVRDPKRVMDFYRDVLGIVPTDIDEEGRGAEFTLADGSTFGIWKPDGTENASGGAVMFAVEDITQAIAEFRGRGAEITDPSESPVCFMAFGSDPEGNGYIIHQRKTRD